MIFTDILLAIARQVSASLEEINVQSRPGYFTNLFHEIAEFLQAPVEVGMSAELSVGISKITTESLEAWAYGSGADYHSS